MVFAPLEGWRLVKVLLPTRSAEDFHLLSRVHAWHTKGASGARIASGAKALDPDPFPCRSLRHAVYAALLHFGLETAQSNWPAVRFCKCMVIGGSLRCGKSALDDIAHDRQKPYRNRQDGGLQELSFSRKQHRRLLTPARGALVDLFEERVGTSERRSNNFSSRREP
jgi:hypothetical protein